MSQTRAMSLTESCASTAIGFAVAIASQVLIYPFFGIHVTFSTNFRLTCVFTVISIARGYLVRRVFTRRTEAV